MDTWNQFGIVMAVLGGLVMLLLWLKKGGYATVAGLRSPVASGKVRELKVIDKLAVSAQHTLVLVQVQDKRLLVCLSPGGAQTTILEGSQQC